MPFTDKDQRRYEDGEMTWQERRERTGEEDLENIITSVENLETNDEASSPRPTLEEIKDYARKHHCPEREAREALS